MKKSKPHLKFFKAPGAWLLFGFIGHPVVSVIIGTLGEIVFAPFGLPSKPPGPFGYGGVLGLFMGPPLGFLTALVAYGVGNGRQNRARILAVVGGGLGIFAVLQTAPPSVYTYTGDFGFVATPLIWCAALILWGFLARPNSKVQPAGD